jgi:hypothetical protein
MALSAGTMPGPYEVIDSPGGRGMGETLKPRVTVR